MRQYIPIVDGITCSKTSLLGWFYVNKQQRYFRYHNQTREKRTKINLPTNVISVIGLRGFFFFWKHYVFFIARFSPSIKNSFQPENVETKKKNCFQHEKSTENVIVILPLTWIFISRDGVPAGYEKKCCLNKRTRRTVRIIFTICLYIYCSLSVVL